MLLTRNRRAVADDVTVLVQRDGFALRPSERSEVAHLAGTPQECVLVIAHDAVGGDLAAVVDGDGVARGPAAGAEVDRLSVPPEERVVRLAVLPEATRTNRVATVVDRDRGAVAAAPA